jgi:hypothetical protein
MDTETATRRGRRPCFYGFVIWHLSTRARDDSRQLADRHYNRQKPGTPQFVPTGSCLVLHAGEIGEPQALWVTSWPRAEYVRHKWPGAWINSLFRNEGAGLSSDLIRQAVAATRAHYGEPPSLGMVTFVNAAKTATRRSSRSAPGECYRRAGFQEVGRTKVNSLIVLQLLPEDMPPAHPFEGQQIGLWS